ncbi:cytidylyltransferase domain-containing protein [Chrysiogenes arsenatis]|uniref:cytidylyltransferase domain-containing protein n=1 Tax=Chrysiogenes arsenatis TaxID=309797 RepID=UPI0005571FCD|nr:glycosyltransferase family protein [Chrysiogenes arsenatis]
MILALLQARSSSNRLPGKVLKPILGKPMILHQMERVARSRHIDQLVLVTSTDPADDELATTVRTAGFEVFRGSLDNVLERFVLATKHYGGEIVVRLTGDCPLHDPDVIDAVISTMVATPADYVSNTLRYTWPDGLDVEVVRAEALFAAHALTESPFDREHVTPFIRTHVGDSACGNFTSLNVVGPSDFSGLRWTVDYPEDFAFVELVYAALYDINPYFTWLDIISLLIQQPAMIRRS